MEQDSFSDPQIREILSLSKVSVVGMSKNPSKAAHYVPKYLFDNGYDITPVNLGHTLLIPKGHHENLFEIPDDTLREIGPTIKKIAEAVKEGTKADGINIGMNNGPAAGQVVFHAHIHIMPRFLGDGYKLWHGKEYDEESTKKIAENIRNSI